MAADDQGTGSLMQTGDETEQRQSGASAHAHCSPSAAALHAPAPGVKTESAVVASLLPGPVPRGDHFGQSRSGGGGGSGDVSGGCSILSRGSSILCLSDLSSNQADQGLSEREGGVGLHGGEGGVDLQEDGGGVGLHEGEGGMGLDEGAAALPGHHVDLQALPQDGMHTFKVGLGLRF